MIVDKLEHIGRYGDIIPQCGALAAFFAGYPKDLPGEKTEVPNSPYVFAPFAYTTKREARWETHHEHMDIHIVLEGAEAVHWIPAHHLTQSIEYVPERDVEFFSDSAKGSSVLVEAGYFCLVMPEDAHKPAMANGEPAKGFKAVLKGDAK